METQHCKPCNSTLPLTEFNLAKSNPYRTHQLYCRTCSAKKAREQWVKNKEHKMKMTIINNEKIKDRNYNFLYRWMKRFALCFDCGHKDIRVLEFDHVRGKKYKGVKDMCNKTASINAIKNEIRKCEVRCCNCHRIKTQKQFNQRTSLW